MADIKFLVSIDTKAGTASLKEFEGAVDGLGKTGSRAGSQFQDGLIAKIAAGVTIANLATKAWHGFVGIGNEAVQGAMAQEQADADLTAALELTGRTVKANRDHYLAFAQAQQLVTKYQDEEIERSQALLLQVTNLDQKGIDRAMKGAMGLASVMGMDLYSATMAVTKGMEGNYQALGRVGLKVDENLSAEQKQASLLSQLEALYGRSTAEINTYGGGVNQLKKSWSEALETLGTAVTKNEGIQKIVKDVTKVLQDFVADGTAEEWAEKVSRALDTIVRSVTMLRTMAKGPTGWGQAIADELVPLDQASQDMADRNKQRVREFRDSLENFHPTMATLRDEIEKGEASWSAYTTRLSAADKAFTQSKGPITDWIKGVLGIKEATNETGNEVKEKSQEIAKFIRDMNKDVAASTKAQFDASREAARAEYRDRLDTVNKMKGTEAEHASARAAAASALSAKLKKIDLDEAEAIEKIRADLTNKIAAGYEDQYQAARIAADNEYRESEANIAKTVKAGEERDQLLILSAQARAAAMANIDREEAAHRGDLQKKIADGAKAYDEERKNVYKAYVSAASEAQNALAMIGKKGFAAELLQLRQEKAAKIQAIKDDEKMAGNHKAELIEIWEGYYKKAEKQAKQAKIVEYASMAFDAIAQVATAALSSVAQKWQQFYENQLALTEKEYEGKNNALDDWYEQQKEAIENSVSTEEEKQAALEALDKEYAQKQEALQKEQEAKEWGLKKKAFEAQKKVDIETAYITMASSILSALATKPFLVGLAMAALAGTLGMIQINAIKQRSFPLAGGAIFREPTQFVTAGGRSFETGDDGVEIMQTEKMLRRIVREETGGRSGAKIIHVHNYMGGKKVDEYIIKVANDGFQTGQIRTYYRNMN